MGYNDGVMFLPISALIITFLFLLLISAVHPRHSNFSRFELKRRAKAGDRNAARDLKREQSLGDVISLKNALEALLLVTTALVSVAVFGWSIGIMVAIFVSLEYRVISRASFIRKIAQKLYGYWEASLLKFARRTPYLMVFLRSVSKNDGAEDGLSIASRQELKHLIEQSDTALSTEEKDLIAHGLAFGDQLAGDIMTPREQISSISKNEMLGPLVLDELHRANHNKLPVTGRDIDHIVGILHLDDLLSLDIKRSITVAKAMKTKVFFINEHQSLYQALGIFLDNDTRCLIVVDKDQKTVGLITLGDIIEALTGQKPTDN